MEKYITCGVQQEIPLWLQWLMWEMIDELPVAKDYLQIFNLSAYHGKQRVVHKQEQPTYEKEYLFFADEIITGKIYVIDGVMMLSEEY